MPEPIIQFSDASKWFGSNCVLKGVTLPVEEKSVTVICGPSGSGKSTLLRCINGLEKIQSGSIRVMGRELDADVLRSIEFRSNIGMVFQKFSLYPHMRVMRNVTLALRKIRGMSKAQAELKASEMLDRVGVLEKANAYPGELSGGQQQRVAIARALVMEPRIMLFDEPTSALDPEMIREVLDVIRSLTKSGMTLVLVTHEMGFARGASSDVVFMDEGEVVEKSPSEKFFEKPTTRRAQQFLDQILHH